MNQKFININKNIYHNEYDNNYSYFDYFSIMNDNECDYFVNNFYFIKNNIVSYKKNYSVILSLLLNNEDIMYDNYLNLSLIKNGKDETVKLAEQFIINYHSNYIFK